MGRRHSPRFFPVSRAHPTEGLWHCVIPEGEPVAPFHGLDMVAMVPSNFVSDMLKCSL